MNKSPWKLRFIPTETGQRTISDLLDLLALDGRIIGWAPGVYEPETLAFGGELGIQIAHTLFHHDSRHLLQYAAVPAQLGQREVTVLLCSVLLRAAGLDWYEQGDVWARVADLRADAPAALPEDPHRVAELTSAMRHLMTADTRGLWRTGQPLAGQDGWFGAFETAGQALAHHDRHGRLDRGLRAVLAHHMIFHANRAGLSLSDQATMAALALNNTVLAAGEHVHHHHDLEDP